MTRPQDPDRRPLEILLSAVSSVLRGTVAIAHCAAHEHMDWKGGGEVIVSVEIAALEGEIAGSRTVSPSIEEMDTALARIDPGGLLWVPGEWTEIVCGMAAGADLAGKAWAEARGKDVWPEPVTTEDIRRFGKYLGPRMRNRRMSERADAAILFWDGKSGGTADMAIRMLARHKPCEVIPWAPRRREPARPAMVSARYPDLAEMIAEQRSYIEIGERLNVTPRAAAKIVAEFQAQQRSGQR